MQEWPKHWGRKKTTALAFAKISPARARRLERLVEELRKLEKWVYRYRHEKDDLYQFLSAVIVEYWEWQRQKKSNRNAEAVRILFDIAARKNKTPLHILLEAAAPGHKGTTRSRWLTGFSFVSTKKKLFWANPMKFWKKFGGIKGCADLAAKRPYKKRKNVSKGDW
jgi:hypothetical protein